MAKAEGLYLHLSSNSTTGYKGVTPQGNRFYARATKGQQKSLGTFGTALEAAVAYAQHVGPAMQDGEQEQPSTLPPSPLPNSSEAASRKATKFCVMCGHAGLPARARFCSECGEAQE